MHDILVALAFVAMVACPAIIAAFPQREIDEEKELEQTSGRHGAIFPPLA